MAIVKYGEKIPYDRKEKLLSFIKEYLGKDEVTQEELEHLAAHTVDNDCYTCFSKHVAQNVTNYSEFAREWREHFVETMQPKYMPKNWKTARKTEESPMWVPQRLRDQKCFL